MILHALTLWQPWAWAVAHAGKGLENRDWRPPAWLVGKPLAIHAGKAWDPDAADFIERVSGRRPPESAIRGAIVAVARLGGFVKDAEEAPPDQRLWFIGRFGWLLEDVVSFEPVPCRGAQKLWTVPSDVCPTVLRRCQVHGAGSFL
jgi:hypothetical protein